MAIAQARTRWPHLSFLCQDAARLSPAEVGRFHAVLIRRPDLFARPGNWQQVFAALPALLWPEGRVLVMLMGAGETAVARRWLEKNGLHIVGEAQEPDPEGGYLLVATLPSHQPEPG